MELFSGMGSKKDQLSIKTKHSEIKPYPRGLTGTKTILSRLAGDWGPQARRPACPPAIEVTGHGQDHQVWDKGRP